MNYMKRTLFLVLALFAALSSFSQEAIKISHGPYLQALGERGVTIVWTTNRKAIGWVELAPDDSTHFYLTERPAYFASDNGFKNVSTVHSVKLEGLRPGTVYRYRVYSQEVLSHQGTDVQYGKVAATSVYRKEPLRFTTADPSEESVSFAIVNDIHGKNDVLENLLGHVDWERNDLVFFNGDMVSNIQSEEQLFGGFMDTAVRLFASEAPMYYSRGNHETRGNFASAFPDYFPTSSGNLYYLLRRGPVCFVVLDCGEDKPDSDIEYSGIVAFDQYRSKQAAWLKEALQSETYREAPYKVAICHMPPFGGWHGEQEIAEKFVPLLNEAGAQVMLCGHFHRAVRSEAGEGGRRFPVLVNDDATMLRAHADAGRMKVEVVDQEGKVVDTMVIDPR